MRSQRRRLQQYCFFRDQRKRTSRNHIPLAIFITNDIFSHKCAFSLKSLAAFKSESNVTHRIVHLVLRFSKIIDALENQKIVKRIAARIKLCDNFFTSRLYPLNLRRYAARKQRCEQEPQSNITNVHNE